MFGYDGEGLKHGGTETRRSESAFRVLSRRLAAMEATRRGRRRGGGGDEAGEARRRGRRGGEGGEAPGGPGCGEEDEDEGDAVEEHGFGLARWGFKREREAWRDGRREEAGSIPPYGDGRGGF